MTNKELVLETIKYLKPKNKHTDVVNSLWKDLNISEDKQSELRDILLAGKLINLGADLWTMQLTAKGMLMTSEKLDNAGNVKLGTIINPQTKEIKSPFQIKKEQNLKYIRELILEASSWKNYDGYMLENFVDKAKLIITKIMGPTSIYINEIDVLSNGKRQSIVADWKEQTITILEKIKFEVEIKEEILEKKLKTIDIHCNKCNHSTTHSILIQNTERLITPELVGTRTLDFWLDTTVQVIKCGSCSEYALRKYNTWCDDAPDFPKIDVQVIPKRGVESIKPAETFTNVPIHITSLYKEVIEPFINELPLLCAGGLRAILEALCTDKGIKSGLVNNKKTESLKGKINGLHEAGLLTEKHSEILIHHQYLGDKALHKLEIPSNDELKIAIEIIAHTLGSIYELEFKGKELKNHTEKRKNKS